MLGSLKKLYPVRELARIVDFHFDKIERLFVRIDELDRLVRQTQELVQRSGQTLQEREFQAQEKMRAFVHAEIDHAVARLGSDFAVSHAEGAEDRATLLQGITFAVEQVQEIRDRLQRESQTSAEAHRNAFAAVNSLQGGLGNLAAGQAKLEADSTAVREAVDALQTKLETEIATALSAREGVRETLALLQAQAEGATVELAKVTPEINGGREQVMAGISGLLYPAICLRAANYDFENPELGLLAHLKGSLAEPTALDIGANVGEVSERLLAAGYNVFAFEPCPATFAHLIHRFKDREKFHAIEIAIGSQDCRMDLHLAADLTAEQSWPRSDLFHSLMPHSMPEQLEFTQRIGVTVRSIESLLRTQEIPAALGLVKIDTEGFDLEVMRGLGDLTPDVVMAEFWDHEMVFGRSGSSNRLEAMVEDMAGRGYARHIVFYRLDNKPVSYYCNYGVSVSGSWGNVVFFQNQSLFREALDWCRAVLPQTYFS